ncbi:MAG: CbbQ/NirQ/NorQ/GpvN family protein [Firmicutes bacterium HGW-Firmicutes-12]|jgi:nitric oxide reductase NorQ protein|nr:MAG: CbbQ/NirQ/NorQ/GpvN family protein [Firmicutes bacterium HGW-Firmicutes-12]
MNKSLEIPVVDPFFYIDAETRIMLNYFETMSHKNPINILVTGKQGSGKSSLVRQFAAVYQRPMATFQVGILSEPGQLFGEHALVDGATHYRPFLFPQALQTPGCVIHLEEINRPEHPKALNMLFSVLADDRSVWIDEMGLIKVAKGVVIFATMNEGEEFVGTEMLDPALRDRFYTILMDYIPADVEIEVLVQKTGVDRERVREIVNIVNKIRGHSETPLDVSTRTSLMIAEMVAAGASIREAITYSLQMDREQLEAILLALHLEKGLLDDRKTCKYILFTGELDL